ncbi:MAG: dethiobiotin synthase [Gammaproteobacteria bacterium]|nr:dethiobiotin synthase [Gammaproteobacteria bacterium]
MARGVLVTGTDTGVGKSVVAATLLYALKLRRFRACGMKPVASGCEEGEDGLRNGDAQLLLTQSSHPVAYDRVNRYRFAPAIAPHIAAQQVGVTISVESIVADYHRMAAEVEWVVVEGVGGWRVPLNDNETVADLAQALALPLVVVVGIRLGAINHALLTLQAIAADGMTVAGWVASVVDPQMAEISGNVEAIAARTAVPHLGTIPYLQPPTVDQVLPSLQLDPIFR